MRAIAGLSALVLVSIVGLGFFAAFVGFTPTATYAASCPINTTSGNGDTFNVQITGADGSCPTTYSSSGLTHYVLSTGSAENPYTVTLSNCSGSNCPPTEIIIQGWANNQVYCSASTTPCSSTGPWTFQIDATVQASSTSCDTAPVKVTGTSGQPVLILEAGTGGVCGCPTVTSTTTVTTTPTVTKTTTATATSTATVTQTIGETSTATATTTATSTLTSATTSTLTTSGTATQTVTVTITSTITKTTTHTTTVTDSVGIPQASPVVDLTASCVGTSTTLTTKTVTSPTTTTKTATTTRPTTVTQTTTIPVKTTTTTTVPVLTTTTVTDYTTVTQGTTTTVYTTVFTTSTTDTSTTITTTNHTTPPSVPEFPLGTMSLVIMVAILLPVLILMRKWAVGLPGANRPMATR